MVCASRLNAKGYIKVNRVQQRWPYAQLVGVEQGQRSTILLGRYDELSPTALLDVALASVEKLTVSELRWLLAADKSMRLPDRGRGRPRKRPRW